MIVGKRSDAYPDPREGMMPLQLAAIMDPGLAADAEASLDLSRAKRREIQQRLRLAEHDPNGIDGVFGPATRAAISAWQKQAGLPATGFISERTLGRLMAETNDEYHARSMAEAARRDQDRRTVAVAPVPRPRLPDGCARLNSGKIAYGHNFRCDAKGLREDLSAVGRMLAHVIGSFEPSRSL
jgi:hypothetical protein